MCEHFVARATEPFRLDALWPFAERLERFGIAGFGWGAAWLTGDGSLASYRDLRAFRDDPTRVDIGAHRDDRRARPPASALASLDADRAGYPTVRRSGRPIRVQPQRRPARLQGTPRDLPRAGSDPRPCRHRGRGALARGCVASRRIGRPDARGAARSLRRPGEPRGAPAGRRAIPLRGQRRESGLLVPAGRRSASSRPGSTRWTARSSGSWRPTATDRRLVPLHTTVTLDPLGASSAVA